MQENELMGSMKVSKAVAKMAIPSVISSLVTVVYNMADTFFVGMSQKQWGLFRGCTCIIGKIMVYLEAV